MVAAPLRTDERIVDEALRQFGARGYEATSLDAIAGSLGIRKQTILYWFSSKEGLLDAAVERAATDLVAHVERALAGAPPGVARVNVVLAAVFRFGVRRPEVLGLLRELDRLGPGVAERLRVRLAPLVDRAVALLEAEMRAGSIRRADPRVLIVLLYATVVGVATEVEAQRAVGLEPGIATLRVVRRELLAFVRAALAP